MKIDAIVRPQPSERWAMYRLICPVVDKACDVSRLEPFFEYSQPNGPNRRLSADIALMKNDQPIWLIEAKRFNQRLHPDLITPYLKECVMGIVTNGNHWIFCVQGKTFTAGPLLNMSGQIDESILECLVALISTDSEDAALAQAYPWSSAWQPFARSVGPNIWRSTAGTGARLFVEKHKFSTLMEAVSAAQAHVQQDTIVRLFLDELIVAGQEITTGMIEVSTKRLIWWLPDRRRAARVNLEGKQLEILILNELLDSLGRNRVIASVKIHDKNHKMSICKASTLAEVRSLVPIFELSV